MSKKEILITTVGLSSVGQSGGISSYVHDLATNLSLNKNDVTVFLIGQNSCNAPIDINYSFKYFEISKERKGERKVVITLMDAVNLLNPNIIINNDVSYISGLWPLFDKNIIRISIMHGFSKKPTFNNAGIIGKLATLNWKYVDYIVCQNKQMVLDVSKKYGVPLTKLICIPQTANVAPRKKLEKSDEFNITFAGGNNKRKGSVEAYKIAMKLKETNLKFSFNWCLPAKEFECEFNNDERFVFKGKLSRNQFFQVLEKSNCIIIPTHMDTGPMLLVEAMAFGIIPICNNLKESAIPDFIEDKVNGFLVKGNKTMNYVNVLFNLMEKSSLWVGENAYDYFQENLTVENQMKRFKLIFKKNGVLLDPEKFNDKHIIHYHLYDTRKFSRYSMNRIVPKLLNSLEIPMRANFYNNWIKYLLK